MSKELFISSSPHETKVAVLEDDQLVEVYYERDTHTGLVGGIYKGRVSRVLPGMQSAFVDIGLERDAFLYVSDFFEDAEEYDKIVAEAEARVTRYAESAPPASPAAPGTAETAVAGEAVAETAPREAVASSAPAGLIADAVEPQPLVVQPASAPPLAAAPPETTAPASAPPVAGSPQPYERPQGQHQDFRRGDPRGRRRRRHGRQFGERKFGPKPEFRDRPPERHPRPEPSPSHTFEVLPGESLAKHKQSSTLSVDQPPPPAASAEHQAPILDEVLRPGSVPAAEAETPQLTVSAEPESQMPGAPEVAPLEAAQDEGEATHVAASADLVSHEEPAGSAVASEGAPTIESASSAASASEAAEPNEVSPATHFEPEPSLSETSQPSIPEPPPESKPRPLWDRLVSTVMGRPPGTPAEAEEAAAGATAPEPAPSMEAQGPEMAEPVSETLKSEVESGGAVMPPETGAVAAPEEAAPGVATPEAPPPAREYTLREPHQRPRFAPRRRGHFGRGQRDFTPGGHAPRRESPRPGNNQPVQIAELLKEGQEILVQIAKEPLGRKGARITSHIALPGRYLVYMPTVNHIGVSRKIASEEERLRLKNIILDNRSLPTGGFIVRTAGAGRPEDELKADMKFLSTLWTDIRANAEKTRAPALLHRDLDLMQRILRDLLSPDFKCVRVDSEIEYERAVEFVSRCQPSLVGHVKLYTRDAPLFEEFGIQAEIDKALKSKVWLKSGGYIVINQTEALVAIDVNTGKYVGKTNRLEDTIVKTNIDAVKEIVRQIRLRDLGGIIVIDFIDMDERRNRNKVVQALEEALRFDRAPTKVLAFNDFGLVAITRKRVKQSLERTLCEPCPSCSGSGWIKSVTTVCYEILSEARKMAAEHEGDSLTLRVHPDVARALKSREGIVLSELESITHKDIIVKSDPNVHQERFEIY